jgi:TatD DNase family protein
MTARAIDTHAHLNSPRLLRHLDAVLARAREAGVGDIIVIGWDVPMSETAVRLAQTHPHLWATVGLHPGDAREEANPESFRRLRTLATEPCVVAVGETGLDFYRNRTPRPLQLDALRWHLDLAGELGLRVVLHCRSAQDELLEAVAGYRRLRMIWHCFDGTVEHARQAVALGMYLGFGGMITYERSHDMREALAWVPVERLLLETDAPYLSPEPHRSKDNEPANVVVVAEEAARVRGVDTEALIAATAANAATVFELDDGG